jgi:hypothetical protein
MVDRNIGVKSSVAIAILLSKRQPRKINVAGAHNGPPAKELAHSIRDVEASFAAA